MSVTNSDLQPTGDDIEGRDKLARKHPLACAIKSASVFIVLCSLIVLGKYLAMQPGLAGLDRVAQPALSYVLLVFVVAAAIPFVPGAEIGFGLVMVFGAEVALQVYFSMLLALILAFLAGQIVPPEQSARRLRLFDAKLRLLKMQARNKIYGNSVIFVAVAFQLLTRNKHLGLFAVLNTPGNSVLGGGGEIAFLAGASRRFSFFGFAVTASVAVLPIPLFFLAVV